MPTDWIAYALLILFAASVFGCLRELSRPKSRGLLIWLPLMILLPIIALTLLGSPEV